MYYIVFDIETTDAPRRIGSREIYSHIRMAQIAWQVYDDKGTLIEENDLIIKPEGYVIPPQAARIHGITTEIALARGIELQNVLPVFFASVNKYNPIFVGHNIDFDINVLKSELSRIQYGQEFDPIDKVCTMKASTNYCRIPSSRPGAYKWPSLSELYRKLFGKGFDNAHHAHDDVRATAECLFRLIELKVITPF